MWYLFRHRYTNPEGQVAQVNKFCTVVPNVELSDGS